MALKVVYPTPPPTSNCLDPRQRAQLLRSSKKLAKLLGATPRFVDTDSEDSDSFFSESPRGSESSSDSFDRSFTPLSRTASASTSVCPSSRHGRSHSDSAPPSRSDTPVMRIALPQHQFDELDDAGFMLRPKSIHRLLQKDSTPTFAITSTQAQRRAKMDRLRRKFGDDIPAELVFPEDQPPPAPVIIEERGAQFVVVNRDKPLPVLPPTSRRSPRDSLLVHRIRSGGYYDEDEESLKAGYRLSLIIESGEDFSGYRSPPTPTDSDFTDEGSSF